MYDEAFPLVITGASISSPSIIISKLGELATGLARVIVVERRTESSMEDFLKVDAAELGELGLSTIPEADTVTLEVAGLDV